MLVELLIAVLIVGLLVGLALYVIDLLPLPSPFGNVAKVLVRRNNMIVKLRERGVTLEEIGLRYGITKMRVFQIVLRERKRMNNKKITVC